MFALFVSGIICSSILGLISIAYTLLILSDIPPSFTLDEAELLKLITIATFIIITATTLFARNFKHHLSVGILIIVLLVYFTSNYFDFRDFYFYTTPQILMLNKIPILCYSSALVVLFLKIIISKVLLKFRSSNVKI